MEVKDPLAPLRAALEQHIAAADSYGSNPLTKMYGDGFRQALKEVGTFAAQHTLLDLSVCGPQCPAWSGTTEFRRHEICWGRSGDYMHAPTGQPCSVLAARKDDDSG
jgi:hypothetical protein